MLEHQVWAEPAAGGDPVMHGAFASFDWQWAEKLGQVLRDQGRSGVEILDCDDGEGEEWVPLAPTQSPG